MIDLLNTLSTHLDSEANNIVETLVSSHPYSSEIFDAPISFESLEQRPDSLAGKKGIYIFLLTNDVPLSREQTIAWNGVPGAGFKKWKQGDLHTGECLYVGSCISKSLYVRIREHFLGDGEATALKLGHKNRQCVLRSVRVYAFPAKAKFEKHFALILPAIEKRLHSALAPKAGSSRT